MMRRLILLGVSVWVLAAGTEARDWGFSKDTVYESSSGRDTVWLMNRGVDTLRLDTLFGEGVGTSNWLDVSFLYRALEPPSPQYFYHHYGLAQGFSTVVKLAGDRIPPSDSILLRNFDIASACPVSKPTAITADRDSLVVRLRFKSDRADEDTLIVKGHYCSGTSIFVHGDHPLHVDYRGIGRDVLGRKFIPSRRIPVLTIPNP